MPERTEVRHIGHQARHHAAGGEEERIRHRGESARTPGVQEDLIRIVLRRLDEHTRAVRQCPFSDARRTVHALLHDGAGLRRVRQERATRTRGHTVDERRDRRALDRVEEREHALLRQRTHVRELGDVDRYASAIGAPPCASRLGEHLRSDRLEDGSGERELLRSAQQRDIRREKMLHVLVRICARGERALTRCRMLVALQQDGLSPLERRCWNPAARNALVFAHDSREATIEAVRRRDELKSRLRCTGARRAPARAER